MKANELRIGNLFQDRSGKILRLEYWYRNKPAQKVFTEKRRWNGWELVEDYPLTEDLEYCKPIPLTEERLLEFGFEKDVSKYNICWFLNHVYIWFVDGKYINELDLPIDYVHQLQNLYFTLKGEELTYGGNK
jgi:hypothetical protein